MPITSNTGVYFAASNPIMPIDSIDGTTRIAIKSPSNSCFPSIGIMGPARCATAIASVHARRSRFRPPGAIFPVSMSSVGLELSNVASGGNRTVIAVTKKVTKSVDQK